MVSNEEIKRMLEAKRKGINIENEKIKSKNYKVCPNCKSKNPEKALFCVNCGKKLEKDLMIKCPSCNTENAENAKFCVKCGEPLNQTNSKNLPEKTIDILESTGNDTKNDIKFINSINGSESPDKPEKTQVNVSKNSKTRFPSEVPEHDIIGETGSKKICPSCSGKNLKNAKFCIVCGKNFDETDDENRSSHISSEDTIESEKPVTTKKNSTPEIKVPNSILELKNEGENEESDKKDEIEEVGKPENKTENIDPVEKIKKAKELLDIGAITSEEFENIKKKYLELI